MASSRNDRTDRSSLVKFIAIRYCGFYRHRKDHETCTRRGLERLISSMLTPSCPSSYHKARRAQIDSRRDLP